MEEIKTKTMTLEMVKEILSKLNFAKYSMLDFEWDFQVASVPNPEAEKGNLLLMRTSFMRKDIVDGTFDKGWGRWHTTPLKTASETSIVMTAWVCVKMIIEHELLEGFEYKETKVFNPHKSLTELVYPDTL